MNRVHAIVGATAAGTVLAACGSSSTPPGVIEAVGPVDQTHAPTWGGCHVHSTRTIDYIADAPGARTRAAALAPYRQEGDHVVVRPARAHRRVGWLLVDSRNVIHTSVELWHSEHGWLVNVVEKCAE